MAVGIRPARAGPVPIMMSLFCWQPVLSRNLRQMQPVAWRDWQVVDTGIWGTIHVDQAAQTFSLAKRFYMHSNFSRFIRPGSVFIDSNNSNLIAALILQKTSLTLVICNTSTSAAAPTPSICHPSLQSARQQRFIALLRVKI